MKTTITLSPGEVLQIVADSIEVANIAEQHSIGRVHANWEVTESTGDLTGSVIITDCDESEVDK